MIRREDGNDWLLISQVDHAHLAAEIAAVWGNESTPSLPSAELLVPAIQDHDEGWREWEKAPQIDPETGWPRNFTEMPMPVATEIWSRSIDVCRQGGSLYGAAVAKFRQALASDKKTLTLERQIVFNVALRFEDTFVGEDVVKALRNLGETKRVSRSSVYRTLTLLHNAALIALCSKPNDPKEYRVAYPVPKPSAFAGIWVSSHFCWLAEMAKHTRRDDPQDQSAITNFLDEQAKLQSLLLNELRQQVSENDLRTRNETGFRFVQFFDRISLWLCCAPRSEPYETPIPCAATIVFVPRVSQKILVEPFPLSVETLKLSALARRISAKVYRSDSELQDAIGQAPLEMLEWEICR